MRTRRARTDEGGALAALWLRSRVAAVPDIPAPVHGDAEVVTHFETVVLANREVWVAEDGDRLLALLVLDDAGIDQLYVEPGRTGRGIGSELVALAKRRRPAGLTLWTFEANVGARRFYERHGFVVTGATAGDNEEGAPDVRYEWRPSAGPRSQIDGDR